jgi:hypothetical protein
MADGRIRQWTAPLEVSWHRRRNAQVLAGHREQFRQFYAGLPDQQDIYFMFFSRGLLHWVLKSLSYVPDHVNLVLLGTDLPDDEQDWIRKNLKRPFHNIGMRVNDKIAWTFLFEVNEFNFGWLDIDCLVLNSDLFDDMRTVADRDSVNGTWWFDSDFGFELSATYFMFFNVQAIKELRAARIAHSPNCYAYHTISCPPFGQNYYSEPITRRARRQLLQVVPPDEAGNPRPPAREHHFETTVVPQLMARSLGFGARHVRNLRRQAWNYAGYEELSDEIVHIGAVSYASVLSEFRRPTGYPETELRYLLADNVALGDGGRLPASYEPKRELITAELARAGLTPAAAKEAARHHLISERGLTTNAAELVVS